MADGARFLATTPISHAAGAADPAHLPPRAARWFFVDKYDPLAFLEAVARHRITCTFLVPSQIYGLLDFPGLADRDLSSLPRI